jgi:hypothetical protein
MLRRLEPCARGGTPTGEPTPALRGKDATVVITPHRLRYRAGKALRAIAAVRLTGSKRVGECRGPGSATGSGLEGGTAQGPSLADVRPQPRRPGPQGRGFWTPKFEPSDAAMVLPSNCACRFPLAFFNGFLAVKSMRLFALRTASVGKRPGAPDVSMRPRSAGAAGQTGRSSGCRAGSRPDDSARRSLAAWQTSARPSAVVAGR